MLLFNILKTFELFISTGPELMLIKIALMSLINI